LVLGLIETRKMSAYGMAGKASVEPPHSKEIQWLVVLGIGWKWKTPNWWRGVVFYGEDYNQVVS
jgi:hypothetical protein